MLSFFVGEQVCRELVNRRICAVLSQRSPIYRCHQLSISPRVWQNMFASRSCFAAQASKEAGGTAHQGEHSAHEANLLRQHLSPPANFALPDESTERHLRLPGVPGRRSRASRVGAALGLQRGEQLRSKWLREIASWSASKAGTGSPDGNTRGGGALHGRSSEFRAGRARCSHHDSVARRRRLHGGAGGPAGRLGAVRALGAATCPLLLSALGVRREQSVLGERPRAPSRRAHSQHPPCPSLAPIALVARPRGSSARKAGPGQPSACRRTTRSTRGTRDPLGQRPQFGPSRRRTVPGNFLSGSSAASACVCEAVAPPASCSRLPTPPLPPARLSSPPAPHVYTSPRALSWCASPFPQGRPNY